MHRISIPVYDLRVGETIEANGKRKVLAVQPGGDQVVVNTFLAGSMNGKDFYFHRHGTVEVYVEPEPPAGYVIMSDGFMDPFYAVMDDDLGTIVSGTFPTREQAIRAAWIHHRER